MIIECLAQDAIHPREKIIIFVIRALFCLQCKCISVFQDLFRSIIFLKKGRHCLQTRQALISWSDRTWPKEQLLQGRHMHSQRFLHINFSMCPTDTPLSQVAVFRITIDTYLPVFASMEIKTDRPGRASVGGFFKAQATYSVSYRNGDSCDLSGCRNVPQSCSRTGWSVASQSTSLSN